MSELSAITVLIGIGVGTIVVFAQTHVVARLGIVLGFLGLRGGYPKIFSKQCEGVARGCGGGRGALFIPAALAMLIATAATFWDQRDGFVSDYSDVTVAAVATADVQSAETKYANGHFKTLSLVNGQPIRMLVDTGASIVMLRHEDAVSAGFVIGDLTFDTPVLTANGPGYMAVARMETIAVEGVSVAGLKVAIAKPGQLHTSLLGMNFIAALDEVIIRKDRMIFKN